mgnify:FL=1
MHKILYNSNKLGSFVFYVRELCWTYSTGDYDFDECEAVVNLQNNAVIKDLDVIQLLATQAVQCKEVQQQLAQQYAQALASCE